MEEGGTRGTYSFLFKETPRQTRYIISEKECLAVVEVVKHFEAYLLGTAFTIVTNHKALLALQEELAS